MPSRIKRLIVQTRIWSHRRFAGILQERHIGLMHSAAISKAFFTSASLEPALRVIVELFERYVVIVVITYFHL